MPNRTPSTEKLYSLAELNYLGAKKIEACDQGAALDLYGAAAANAYLYLFDERFASVRNPYDPEFRGACDVYNGALENAMRNRAAAAADCCPAIPTNSSPTRKHGTLRS